MLAKFKNNFLNSLIYNIKYSFVEHFSYFLSFTKCFNNFFSQIKYFAFPIQANISKQLVTPF